MRILIAYDGSAAADAALKEALLPPWPARTKIRLVTVVEWPIALEPPFPDDPGPAIDGVHRILTERGKQTLGKALQAFSSRSDLDVTSELREGSPKHALLDAIETWKPDLVMVGSTGKTRLKGFFLGSVSHALVMHSPCSVQVVKIPESR